MGLFDPPNEKKLSEVYPEGTPFMLYRAEHEGIRNTAYGESHQGTVNVGPADRSGEPEDFRVFGRLAEQLKQVQPGELPTLVTISKVGRSLAWTPVKPSEDIPL